MPTHINLAKEERGQDFPAGHALILSGTQDGLTNYSDPSQP